ncbi:MAG: hypothetical protein ACI9Y1_003071 [Lentisphaeria bacterium]
MLGIAAAYYLIYSFGQNVPQRRIHIKMFAEIQQSFLFGFSIHANTFDEAIAKVAASALLTCYGGFSYKHGARDLTIF